MRKLLFILFVMLHFISFAQDATIKNLQSESGRTITKDETDSAKAWTKGGNMNLNATQGAQKNWAAGGDNFSLAINAYLNYFFFYKRGKINWDNNIEVNFGYIQSSSIGSRKNDDRFDVLTKYGYNFNGKCYVSGLANIRSQFFDGYSYSESDKTFSSSFFSPGYILISAGIDYKPSAKLSIFVSPISTRFIVIANTKLADQGLYGVTAGKHFSNEVGAFSTINWMQPIAKNISYKGRMDLFSNYKNKPENIDIFITNYFSFKISKSFTASYNFDLVYDDDVRIFGKDGTSPGLQLKSLIGLGFQMKLR